MKASDLDLYHICHAQRRAESIMAKISSVCHTKVCTNDALFRGSAPDVSWFMFYSFMLCEFYTESA